MPKDTIIVRGGKPQKKTSAKTGKVAKYYRGRWTGTDGQEESRPLGVDLTAAEYDRKLAELQTELNTGATSRDRLDALSIEGFVEAHAERFGVDARDRTLVGWANAAGHVAKILGSSKSITKLTKDDAVLVRKKLTASGVAPATTRKVLVTFAAMLGRADDAGWIHSHPWKKIRPGAVVSKKPRVFSEDETTRILTAAASDPVWSALIALAIESGLRKSELLHLRTEDVRDGYVYVEAHSGAGLLDWTPKTRKATRRVPIDAVPELERLRVKIGKSSPYFFIDADRLAVLLARKEAGTLTDASDRINNFTRTFTRIRDDAAVYTGTFHDLRKTYGSRLAALGVALSVVANWMGHSSITTTHDHYLDAATEDVERLAREATAARTARRSGGRSGENPGKTTLRKIG